jgi:hypothetical protein
MQTASLFRSYDPAAWAPFFTAVLTAAAALTGLLFVAVSINLRKILPGDKAEPGAQSEGFLAARAAETLATLLLVVVASALTLIPQGTLLLGLEVLILAAPALAVTTAVQVSYRLQKPDQPLWWTISRMACTAVATVPATWAGISLTAHWGGGLYWLAGAGLLGIVGAVYNAWVLLVEILR